MKATDILLLANALLVVGGGGYWLFSDEVRSMFVSSNFSLAMPEYLVLLEQVKTIGPHQGVLTGKVVVIDVEEGDVDAVQALLPDRIRAAVPEEAETLVGVKCSESFSGTYINTGTSPTKGYSHVCNINLIRLADKMVIASPVFSNSPPGAVTGQPQRVVGRRPNQKIADYLATLPQR